MVAGRDSTTLIRISERGWSSLIFALKDTYWSKTTPRFLTVLLDAKVMQRVKLIFLEFLETSTMTLVLSECRSRKLEVIGYLCL